MQYSGVKSLIGVKGKYFYCVLSKVKMQQKRISLKVAKIWLQNYLKKDWHFAHPK